VNAGPQVCTYRRLQRPCFSSERIASFRCLTVTARKLSLAEALDSGDLNA